MIKHKLGVRAHDFGKKTISDMADCLKLNAFMAPQLVFPKAFIEVDSVDDISQGVVEQIRNCFSEFDISVIGCYQDLSNEDKEVRLKAVSRVCKMLPIAKYLGAHVVGSETSHGRFTTKEEKKYYFPYMLDSVKRIIEEAAKVDMAFALEPVYTHPLDSIEAVEKIISEVGDSKHLRLIFDPANLLTPELLAHQKGYFKDWLNAVGTYIDVIHVKDFTWDDKGHRTETALGDGMIDYSVLNDWLVGLDRPIYLVREWLNPMNAEKDLEYMKKLCSSSNK